MKLTLRVKVTLWIVFPLILILGLFTFIEYNSHKETVLSNLNFLASQTSQVIENSLIHEMLAHNNEGIQNTLDAIYKEDTIRILYVLDTSGKVVYAPGSINVGTQFENRDPSCQPCHKLPVDERPKSIVISLDDGARVFRSMNPIENRPECHECHDPDDRLNGILLTDILMAPLEEPLSADLQRNLIWWIGTILVTVIVANIVIGKFVIQRLEGLSSALVQFGRGRLSLRLPQDTHDEIGFLSRSFNEMGQRIEKETSENKNLSTHLRHQNEMRGDLLKRLITAQEDERKRVARELHDVLGQVLSALAIQVEVTGKYIPSDADNAHLQLSEIKKLISKTTDEMYDLIFTLRPSTLDDMGLIAAMQGHADRFLSGSNIIFEIKTDGFHKRMDTEIETAVYRIFQEALTNVLRHSNASEVKVSLKQNNAKLVVEIVDNGLGFRTKGVNIDLDNHKGLGLWGMHERVSQFAGTLEIISKPGHGTRLRINIPNSMDSYE